MSYILPAMDFETIEVFTDLLSNSSTYLEFGAGDSTVYASQNGVKTIISVDSSLEYVQYVNQKINSEIADVNLNIFYVDIGKTGAWGRPVDNKGFKDYHMYYQKPIGYCQSNKIIPDLVLVDGRFRVACFLASVLMFPNVKILFDDYLERPHYHIVESVVGLPVMHGRSALFDLPKTTIQFDKIPFLLAKYSSISK